jgi:PAS domain S-box-containing protein
MGADAERTRNAASLDTWHRLAVEERLALVVDWVPTAIVLARLDGRIEMVNWQAEKIFGYDREELRNKPMEVLMPERFHKHHVTLRDQFFHARSTRPMGSGPELFGLRKDGSEFPAEIGLNPIDLEGSPMVVACIVDVTGRRVIEAHKEQQRLELARSNVDLEEFAYVASHDLKSPLRAISHLVEWISEDIEPTAGTETIDNLKLLRGRVDRLQLLLDGLLDYARIGHARDNVEAVDIPGMVRDIGSALSPPPGFAITCAGPMTPLYTHRASIMVVLQNLIANGIKHHDHDAGHIAVSMRREGGVAEFRVTDDGPGISPRFHDRIFVIFQTLASRDDVESSGIGLSIVKKRIEGHGGRIWVESAPPERGSAFVFTWKELPA